MYQVWTKGDEYSGWQKKDCPDLETASVEILAATKKGQEPLLTFSLAYEVGITIKESEKVEATQSETKPDKVAGGEGN